MTESTYVVFHLADERYALPIGSVERILANQTPTRIPRTPPMFLGLFDLRGETLAALDLRQRLEMPIRDGEANFIVIGTPQGRVALRVDHVEGICRFEDDMIDEAPAFLQAKDDPFLQAVARRQDALVVLLDPGHTVPSKLETTLNKAGKKPALAAA